jgi:hypothetical protein
VKRPVFATIVTVTQLTLGLLWLGVSIYLLYLIRSPEMHQSSDTAAALMGLKIAFWVMVAAALLTLAGAYGMWRNSRWGWWVSLVVNFAIATTLVYSVIDDGLRAADVQDIVIAIASLLLVVLLLLPPVRRFYWRSSRSQSSPPG